MRLSFEVYTASNAEEADRMLAEAVPNYVLCDYWLGRGQPLGTELLERWRTQHNHIKRAALMTGSKATSVVSTCGVDMIFPKPLDLGEVVDWFHDIKTP